MIQVKELHIFILLLALTFSTSAFASPRQTSYPFITGNTLRAHAIHIFDETSPQLDPALVKLGDVIFVKTDKEYLEHFFKKIHPAIRKKYILITHNSDCAAPGSFARHLDEPKLAAWFAQNIDNTKHAKLFAIPIGIANSHWPHGDVAAFKYARKRLLHCKRDIFCYVNFEPATYPKERGPVWNYFSKKTWSTLSWPNKPIKHYLNDLARSKFVISPRGNGLDCHRTLEALLMGAIPVVKSSPLDPLFQDLPVLIVHDWNKVTKSFLQDQYKIMQTKQYNMEKLFLPYWLERICEAMACAIYSEP